MPSPGTLHRTPGQSNCAPMYLQYTRHCAEHDAHVISLHTQNNPIRENFHVPHSADEMTLPKSCPRIQMSGSQITHCPQRTFCSSVAQPHQGWHSSHASIRANRAISFSFCSVARQGVLKPWQGVAESVRAQVGHGGHSLILLRSPT